MTDLQEFFRELKDCYIKERQDFVWDWAGVKEVAASKNLPPDVDMLADYVCFIAYNLAKNVFHGRLPDRLHARMMFEKSDWVHKYVDFLER